METDVREGTYNINTITHKINASDGFLTTLELTPSLLDTYEDVDPEETAIQTEYLSARSNKKEEDTTSGLGNGTGGLFGGFL